MSVPGLHLERHGPKTPVTIIYVHGAPDRSTSFREVLPYLADRHVIVYDRRGYGRSVEAVAAKGMVDHANDLLAIVEACDGPPVVVAHSFGSNPTMLAASLRPGEFGALGLWEPPLPWVDWWPERTKEFNSLVAESRVPADEVETMYRSLLGSRAWGRLPGHLQAQRRAEGPAFQVDMASELRAPFDFTDVSVPTLVGYGTATSAAHAQGARWLAEQLPEARLHVIAGAGHFAPRTHAQEFATFTRAAAAIVEGSRGGATPPR